MANLPFPVTRTGSAAVRREQGDMRKAVLDLYRERGKMSADEAADLLGQSVLAIRPRVSELVQSGMLADTGEMTRNDSGRPARVWAVTQRAG